MFYCHFSVLWAERAVPTWHITAFLHTVRQTTRFRQMPSKVHKSPGFSRMTVFTLLSYREEIQQLYFGGKQEQNTGFMPRAQLHQIAPCGFTAHGWASPVVPVPTHRHPAPPQSLKVPLVFTQLQLQPTCLTPLSSRTFNKHQQSHKSAFYGMAEA